MTKSVSEKNIDGAVPRAEIPGWREKYGVVAGITRKPCDLGLWGDNPVGEVSTRWRGFRQSEAGFPRYVLGNQVHGCTVVSHGSWVVNSGDATTTHDSRPTTFAQYEGIDGHITSDRGTMLCVTIADCTPVYLLALDHATMRPRALALLHAGWRGTAGGILKKGVEALLAASSPGRLVAHLGVSICGDCYQVGPEVFEAVGLPRPSSADGKGQLDVRAILAKQAAQLGIEEITVSSHCSKHGEGWYSHRGGEKGRMVGYLGMAG